MIVGYDLDHLRQYMGLLPTTPLAKLLRGYFLYTGTPLEVDEDEDRKRSRETAEGRDPFDIVMVSLTFEVFQLLSYFVRRLLACCPLRS